MKPETIKQAKSLYLHFQNGLKCLRTPFICAVTINRGQGDDLMSFLHLRAGEEEGSEAERAGCQRKGSAQTGESGGEGEEKEGVQRSDGGSSCAGATEEEEGGEEEKERASTKWGQHFFLF